MMNKILIIGAGRSSTALINYVLKQAEQFNWMVTVADTNPKLAEEKINLHPNGKAAWLDVMNVNDRRDLIARTDLVVSLLPAHLHIEVAYDCIRQNKHLITASYVSKEMYQLGEQARDRNLIFMGEMGLDPGIDHMSAMQKINEIKDKGGKLTSFNSFTGGLIAPESDDNPWHYKFTWNPRNVVMAGQGTAQYLENGKYKYIPYNRLFEVTRPIHIDGVGEYEVYANRDSLLYRDVYGLKDIPNILRGTIRYKGYCEAWNAFVKLGLTDDSYPILESENSTYLSFIESYLDKKIPGATVKERFANFLEVDPEGEVMQKIEWLGLFRKKKIKLKQATPAVILEDILLKKWVLKSTDKDMILMVHEFEYELNDKKKKLTSTMILKGKDSADTAMSRLVGLPLGVFVKLVMQGQIKAKGVQIPVMPEVYNPVLEELEEYDVKFVDKEVDL